MMVSRSGYYKWKNRDGKPNRYESLRNIIKDEIVKTHDKHKIWGYRNRAEFIRKSIGIHFSDLLCHLCCKELGIKSKARRKYNKAGDEHILYPNILDGFNAQRPFQKVCTDTTLLLHKSGRFDWNIYIDLFNNEIVSNDFRLSKSGHGVANHFQAAKRFLNEKTKRGYQNLETIVHSDQGNVYTSRAFNSLFDHTIKRSMSRIATPTDNPIVESLNGWIKDELKFDLKFYQSDNPVQLIKDYVEYFNRERQAYSLKYKTPIQYRTELGYL
jgi:putative transposase